MTHDGVTLNWEYVGANELSLLLNNEDMGKVTGTEKVLSSLTPSTEYIVKLKDSLGNFSNEITFTTLEK